MTSWTGKPQKSEATLRKQGDNNWLLTLDKWRTRFP